MNIQDQLILHEGLKLEPYKDTVGKWTIGVGRNFSDVQFSERELVSLLQNSITKEWCLILLGNDIKQVISELSRFNWFDVLSEIRKKVIIDMVFNLGISRFNGFKKTKQYLESGNYKAASVEMMDSQWSRQVGRRSEVLSFMMRTDTDIEFFDK